MKEKDLKGTFRFSPNVLFQLGRELITNEYQAVLELVKNSYDAGSDWCHVEIQQTQRPPNGTAFPNAVGFVKVTDAGKGMSGTDLLNKWLHISSSEKRQVRASEAQLAVTGKPTSGAKVPLGEKGVGRLAAQRLGGNIEVYTAVNGDCRKLAFSWRDFEKVHDISEIELKVDKVPSTHPMHIRGNGTIILVSDLVAFQGPLWKVRRGIYETFSRLISPFPKAPIEDFRFEIQLNGDVVELLKFDEKLLKNSQRRFHFNYSKAEGLVIDGSIGLDYSGARTKDLARVLYEQYIQTDHGEKFCEWIQMNRKTSQDYGLSWQPKGHPYRFEQKFPTKGLIQDKKIDVEQPAADPGPFEGWLYVYDLNIAGFESGFQSLFDIRKKTEEPEEEDPDVVVGGEAKANAIQATRTFKQLAGIRIYRDGFEVPMQEDWLNLGAQSTESSSYYTIRPSNVLGFVKLTGAQNPYLMETTNRESLVKNAAYANFFALMDMVVERTRMWQALIRRSENAYLREAAGSKIAGPKHAITTSRKASTEVSRVFKRFQTTIDRADSWESAKSQFQELKEIVAILDRFVAEIEDHRREVLQLAALGVTSEAFAHELVRELKNAIQQLKALRTTMRKESAKPKDIESELRHIESMMQTLLSQASEIEPQLKYVRDQKDLIQVRDFVKKFVALNAARLATHDIKLVADVSAVVDESVLVNYGKLSLVFANLLDNSQYWIAERLERKEVAEGAIKVTAQGYSILFEDNGPGIDPTVENSLFEAFETRKPKGKGRGLGLFICRQLLESIGCKIELSAKRNEDGRLHQFVIDLSGVAANE